MALSLTDVLADPRAAADHLANDSGLYGVPGVVGRQTAAGVAVLDVTLRPLPSMAAEGYPVERVRIVIRNERQAYVLPCGVKGRRSKHCNPDKGDLCLDYVEDDPALRWVPEDGLEPLVTRAHVHMMAEECWRRTGDWPFEDAPHGLGKNGPHPIQSARTRRELRRWAR